MAERALSPQVTPATTAASAQRPRPGRPRPEPARDIPPTPAGVVSLDGTTFEPSPALQEALARARSKGLLIEARGGRGTDLSVASYRMLRNLGLDPGVAANVSRVKGSTTFRGEADFKGRMTKFYDNLAPRHSVNFNTTHWLEFEKLIDHKDAYFG